MAKRPEKALFDSLTSGASLERAVLRLVRREAKGGHRAVIRALVQRLYDDPQTRTIGAAGAGMLLRELGEYKAAIAYFSEAASHSNTSDLRLAQLETGLTTDRTKTLRKVEMLLQRDTLSADVRVALLKLLAQSGEHGRFRKEYHRAQSALGEANSKPANYLNWLAQLIDENESPEADESAINIGILGYKSVDRARSSNNTGDWVQSLAALLHILRHRNVTFVGSDAVNDLASKLAKRINPRFHLDTPPARVRLIPVNRDSSNFGTCPEQTYLICNGWYAHSIFRGIIDFPFHPNIVPIFVSFHINDVSLLTESAVAYLKAHAPIGCRDWATVYLLRERNIPAFFTGCLTSTVGGLFPDIARAGEIRSAGFVDCEPEPGELENIRISHFSHRDMGHRNQSLAEALQQAMDLLETYRKLDHIVTSRLHCYYPAKSMGVPAEFRPKSASDIRFEGLLNVDDHAFARMRSALEDKLSEVSTHILSGTTPDRFKTFWEALWQDDVAEAERYCGIFSPAPAPTLSPQHAIRLATLHRLTEFGAETDKTPVTLLLCSDSNQFEYLQVAFKALREHTPGPIDCHLFTRDVSTAEATAAFAAYEGADTRITQYDLSKLVYGPGSTRQRLSHLSVSAFDRVLAPHLLPEIDRILYLDVDTMARSDLRPLFETDLGDAPLAARASFAKDWKTADRILREVVRPLPATDAWDLGRRLHNSGPLSVPLFNSGVMVMNLRHMREENMASDVISLIENSGCHDQDALGIHYRGRIKWLAPEWNYVPAQDYCQEPKIVHWAGPVKPWHKLYSHYTDDWKALHEAVMRKRQ